MITKSKAAAIATVLVGAVAIFFALEPETLEALTEVLTTILETVLPDDPTPAPEVTT